MRLSAEVPFEEDRFVQVLNARSIKPLVFFRKARELGLSFQIDLFAAMQGKLFEKQVTGNVMDYFERVFAEKHLRNQSEAHERHYLKDFQHFFMGVKLNLGEGVLVVVCKVGFTFARVLRLLDLVESIFLLELPLLLKFIVLFVILEQLLFIALELRSGVKLGDVPNLHVRLTLAQEVQADQHHSQIEQMLADLAFFV